MIEKILSNLQAEADFFGGEPMGSLQKMYYCKGVEKAIEIVQEVAKEYGKDTNVPSNGWISCSERLPNWEEYQKNDGRFIVTDGNRVYQSIFDIYANSGFRTLKLFHFVGGTQTANFEVDNCVIAWQPLPAPYQKGE